MISITFHNSNKLIISILKFLQNRLILTSILLTSKFYNDVFYGNHLVAYVGGVNLQEMNLLESEFLSLLDWRIWVDSEEYDFYLKGLMQHFEI